MGTLLAVALLALVACGGDGKSASSSSSSSSSSPSSTTTTTPTSTTLAPEEAVKAAYLAYWKAVDEAFASPTSPDELDVVAGDPLLSFVRDNLGTKASQGHTYLRPADRPNYHRIDSVRVTGGASTLTDCYVDGSVEYDATGSIVDDAISTRVAEATLSLSGGTWLVTDLEFPTSTAGVSGCAA